MRRDIGQVKGGCDRQTRDRQYGQAKVFGVFAHFAGEAAWGGVVVPSFAVPARTSGRGPLTSEEEDPYDGYTGRLGRS